MELYSMYTIGVSYIFKVINHADQKTVQLLVQKRFGISINAILKSEFPKGFTVIEEPFDPEERDVA